jgi:hypothetical protein
VAINYTQLATEINTDPKSLGYAGKSDYAIAVILNTPGASAETIFKAYTDTSEIVAGIVRAEWDALSAANKQFLNEVILNAPKVKTGDSNLRSSVGGIFGVGTTSRTNLVNVASKSATRGEVLFGEGTTISDTDVAKALGRG